VILRAKITDPCVSPWGSSMPYSIGGGASECRVLRLQLYYVQSTVFLAVLFSTAIVFIATYTCMHRHSTYHVVCLDFCEGQSAAGVSRHAQVGPCVSRYEQV
jgi:hypothetical protein